MLPKISSAITPALLVALRRDRESRPGHARVRRPHHRPVLGEGRRGSGVAAAARRRADDEPREAVLRGEAGAAGDGGR